MKHFLSRGVSRDVFAAGFISLLTDISREMIFPLLPIYLTSVLGASIAFVGFVEGIAESTSSILNLVSGWLSDRVPRRRTVMLWGYTLSAVTRPFIALATTGWHILLVRFLEKVGKGIRVPARDALIAESCTPENRGKAFGIHRSLDNVGSILGPLFSFYLLIVLNGDYKTLFWIAAIPAFLAIAILVFLVTEKPREVVSTERMPPIRDRFNLKPFNRTFRCFLLATMVFELSNSSNAFLLLRVKDMGLSLELIPVIYLFCNIFKSLSSMPGGILSDKLGRRNLMVLGWVLYGLSYFCFAFRMSLTEAWVVFGVYGVFTGMTEGIKKAFVADLVPKEIRGSAYGIHTFVSNFLQLPASLLLGIVWQRYNAPLAFSIGGGLAIAGACLLLLFIPSKVETVSPAATG
jgi:MFS family permease